MASKSIDEIDGEVIKLISDRQLESLGMTALGDRVVLKDFVNATMSPVLASDSGASKKIEITRTAEITPASECKKKRKKELLDFLRSRKADNNDKSKITQRAGRPRQQEKSVSFALRVMNETIDNSDRTIDRNAKPIKAPLGDKNAIVLKLPIEGPYTSILSLVRKAFFPADSNPVIGSVHDFTLEIVNSRNQNVQDVLTSEFTLNNYFVEKMIPGSLKLYMLATFNLPMDSSEDNSEHSLTTCANLSTNQPTTTSRLATPTWSTVATTMSTTTQSNQSTTTSRLSTPTRSTVATAMSTANHANQSTTTSRLATPTRSTIATTMSTANQGNQATATSRLATQTRSTVATTMSTANQANPSTTTSRLATPTWSTVATTMSTANQANPSKTTISRLTSPTQSTIATTMSTTNQANQATTTTSRLATHTQSTAADQLIITHNSSPIHMSTPRASPSRTNLTFSPELQEILPLAAIFDEDHDDFNALPDLSQAWYAPATNNESTVTSSLAATTQSPIHMSIPQPSIPRSNLMRAGESQELPPIHTILDDDDDDVYEIPNSSYVLLSPSAEVLGRYQPIQSSHSADQIQGRNLRSCIEHTLNKTATTNDPVEVVRVFRDILIQGRGLDTSPDSFVEGDTVSIYVSRFNLISTTMDELLSLDFDELRKPLEVTFYGEKAKDLGGPRREFFSLVLKSLLDEECELFTNTEAGFVINQTEKNIRNRYFFGAGLLCGLSMLEDGPLPCFLENEQMERLFSQEQTLTDAEQLFKSGFNVLGIVDLVIQKPCIKFLLRHTAQHQLTYKHLMDLLTPEFSDEGTSRRIYEEKTYSYFVSYIKEVAAGRRDGVNMEMILRFTTGSEREPVFGFSSKPRVVFRDDLPWSLPRANTCICQLSLPIGKNTPTAKKIMLERFDWAFVNTYFGYA